jgi:hypothetical protein
MIWSPPETIPQFGFVFHAIVEVRDNAATKTSLAFDVFHVRSLKV